MPSGSDAPRSSLSDYDKFITPNLNRVKHGNGAKDFNSPAIADRQEMQALQEPVTIGSSSPITLSAIGIGLLSLAMMLGLRLRRGLQPATALATSGGLGPLIPANTASAAVLETTAALNVKTDRVGWGQLSSHTSQPQTAMAYKKTAKEMRAKYPNAGKVAYVLTKDVPQQGIAGDVLKVNRGFATNYLQPQGLGEPASDDQIAAFEVKLAERAAADEAAYNAAAEMAQKLIGMDGVTIKRAAGEDGAVEPVSLADVQQVLGLDSKAKVKLPAMDGFGEYSVNVELHKKVTIDIALKLVEA
jgi:large subunit ribosomal protein L9